MSDPLQIQEIVKVLYQNGATAVSQVRYIPKDESLVDRQVRELAIKDARTRVTDMARVSGARVGKVLALQEGASTGQTGTAVTGTTADNGSALDNIGEIELQAVVTVVYELK